MDKLNNYRQYIQEVLTEFARPRRLGEENADEFETQLIFDTKNDHYQVLFVGWEKYKRTFGSPIHIDIKNDKVWIQQNLTDYDFIGDLIEKGIPKEDIVLAFHAPYKRKYTDFAVA
jgi:XisI protein